jgi:hypothetical protein
MNIKTEVIGKDGVRRSESEHLRWLVEQEVKSYFDTTLKNVIKEEFVSDFQALLKKYNVEVVVEEDQHHASTFIFKVGEFDLTMDDLYE